MIKRVIDISQQAYICLKHKQLRVEREREVIATIPVEDIGVLILQHPAIVMTQAAIIACQENNAVLVFCDKQHLPYSVLLPMSEGNSLHTKVLRHQMDIAEPHKKRLWKQIVQHKIAEQALTLRLLGKNDKPVERLIKQVKSGDTENHEAQAAKKYWRLLMGDGFRRDPQDGQFNALLNYGYAAIRAMVARSIVGTGLHPALGLHHSNQYNGLCLADDVMEPFRPWVDYCVYSLAKGCADDELEINRESKTRLLGMLSDSVIWQEKTLPLMTACHSLAALLKEAYTDKTVKILYPQLLNRVQTLL